MEQILQWVQILVALGVFGGIAKIVEPIIQAKIKQSMAKTRNEHILSVEKWAGQTVHYIAQQLETAAPEERKQAALSLLASRISENGLAKNFSEAQIEQFIKFAYDQMTKSDNIKEVN